MLSCSSKLGNLEESFFPNAFRCFLPVGFKGYKNHEGLIILKISSWILPVISTVSYLDGLSLFSQEDASVPQEWLHTLHKSFYTECKLTNPYRPVYPPTSKGRLVREHLNRVGGMDLFSCMLGFRKHFTFLVYFFSQEHLLKQSNLD